MKQYNGKQGCSYCEDEGVPQASSHLHRNWPFVESSVPRTHTSYRQAIRTSLAERNVVRYYGLLRPTILSCWVPLLLLKVKGVKAATVFALHKPFNLAKGFVVDALHCVFLGVVLNLLAFWFAQSHSQSDYSTEIRYVLHN